MNTVQQQETKAILDLVKERDFWKAEAERWRAIRESGWQPIDTAPKDGSRLLLLCEENAGCKIVEGWWSVFSLNVEPNWMPWCGSSRIKSTERLRATHWMLKPFPPSA